MVGQRRTLAGVEWWQTLLVAAVAPAVTAVALVWQNRENNKRDDRRRADDAAERERERQASAAREANARRHSIRDHWREERKEAHAAYLATIESANTQFERQILGLSIDDDSAGISNEMVQEVRESLAAVQILSLPLTRQRAEEAFERLKKTDAAVFGFRVLQGIKLTAEDRARRDEARGELETLKLARAEYLDAVRQELGTEEADL